MTYSSHDMTYHFLYEASNSGFDQYHLPKTLFPIKRIWLQFSLNLFTITSGLDTVYITQTLLKTVTSNHQYVQGADEH